MLEFVLALPKTHLFAVQADGLAQSGEQLQKLQNGYAKKDNTNLTINSDVSQPAASGINKALINSEPEPAAEKEGKELHAPDNSGVSQPSAEDHMADGIEQPIVGAKLVTRLNTVCGKSRSVKRACVAIESFSSGVERSVAGKHFPRHAGRDRSSHANRERQLRRKAVTSAHLVCVCVFACVFVRVCLVACKRGLLGACSRVSFVCCWWWDWRSKHREGIAIGSMADFPASRSRLLIQVSDYTPKSSR